MKKIIFAGAAVALACALTGVTTASASAQTASVPEFCRADVYHSSGFILPGHVVRGPTAIAAGRTVSLYRAQTTVNGGWYDWAEIHGTSAGSDRVWMDVSSDGGAHWDQCGPFSRSGRYYTPATRENSSASVRFRACGDVLVGASRVHACTSWF
ncbi:hypothetical protein [Amycolatopsis sp. NPDC051371]|uniref:hypothetical protein n=1 Tax=Amycolatopsis sp. NPDC051371 TaxID=3155800 RepID=UPI0034380663